MPQELNNKFCCRILILKVLIFTFEITVPLLSIFVLTNEALEFNITSFHQRHNNHTNSSTNHVYAANHRMTNYTNDDNSSIIDHMTSDSVVRPQLALQIYTGPTNPDTNGQDSSSTVRDGRYQQEDHQQGDINNNNNNNNNQHGKYNLITSASNQHNNKKFILSPSSKQAELWQYDTADQSGGSTNNLNPLSSHANNGDSSNESGSFAVPLLAGPMINAIITLPGGSPTVLPNNNHQQLRPPRYGQQDEQHDDSGHNTSSSINVERAISRLIDSQASGNIEFSMNMNGDEIIINPVSKHASSILATSLNGVKSNNNNDEARIKKDQIVQEDPEPNYAQTNRRFARLGRMDRNNNDQQSSVSKSLKRHISSDLAGDEQSASEIDLVDGNNGSNNDDFEDEEGGDGHQATRLASLRRNDSTTNDYDADTPTKSASKNSNSLNKFWFNSDSRSNNLEDDSLTGDDEQVVEETTTYHGKEKPRASLNKRYNNELDEAKMGRAKSVSSRQVSKRKTAGSRRRVQYRDSADLQPVVEDQRSSSSYSSRPRMSQQQKEHNDVSTVVIKGEDVKKFEQLLQNLRSLPINNIAPPAGGNTKRTKAVRTRANHQYDQNKAGDQSVDSDKNNEEAAKSERPTRTWLDPVDRRHRGESSLPLAKGSVQTRSFDVNTECDRRRQQQESQNANNNDDSNTLANDPDSLPNIVDHDPMTSSDGSDELNDEGSENIEHEDSSFDEDEASKRPAAQGNLEASESDLSAQKSSETILKKPKSLFVRKTILQTYYDNNNSNSNKNNPEDTNQPEHKDEAQDDYSTTTSASGDNDNFHRQNTGSSKQMRQAYDNGRRQQHQQQEAALLMADNKHSSLPLNSYIDYNRLDDREVYRGSESQKFKVALAPRGEQIDRVRSFQHAIDRVALGDKRQDVDGVARESKGACKFGETC